MTIESILLPLDGSLQCRQAADLCWKMAKSLNASVTAQYVVDSPGIWDFLRHDLAGFIGSGPYFMAHEAMREKLTELGQTLLDVYETHAVSQGISGNYYLDEGNTIRAIVERADEHDLVVIGHRPSGLRSPNEERRQFRHSNAEMLAHKLNKPLLVVQAESELWSSITYLVSDDRMPEDSLAKCMELARALSLPVTISSWTQTDEADYLDSLLTKIQESEHPFGEIQFSVNNFENPLNRWVSDDQFQASSLVVVPTIRSDGKARTILGTVPDLLIKCWNHPALLFWPEGPGCAGNIVQTANAEVHI